MDCSEQKLLDLRDRDPFPYYRALRGRGPVVWSAAQNSWMVTGYDAARSVCLLDNTHFHRPDAEGGSEYDTISAGRRNVKVMKGTAHRRLHQWLMTAFTPTRAADIQERIVCGVVRSLLENLPQEGRANLNIQLLDKIPVRAIAAVLELPWDDEAWIDHGIELVAAIFNFYQTRGFGRDDLVEQARLAHIDLRAKLDPFLVAGQEGRGGELINAFFRSGSDFAPDWGVEDIYINIASMFLGGSHSTTMALSSAFHLLMNDPALMEEIRAADDARLRSFVEQVIRLHPPQHYQVRRAIEDVEIAGVAMRKGDLVTVIAAAVNRDPEHYALPDAVNFDEPRARDHLTFFSGPHMCVGQGLARVEVMETLKQALPRLRNLRLDPSAPPPVYEGLSFRGWRPLNVLYDLD